MPLKFQHDRLTLRLVRVRQKSYSKTERTDGLSKTTFLDVPKVLQPKSGFISNSIFCMMPTLLWDMEVWKYNASLIAFLVASANPTCTR